MKRFATTLSLTCLLAFATPAYADEAELKARIAELEAKLNRVETLLNKTLAIQEASLRTPAAVQPAAPAVVATATPARVSAPTPVTTTSPTAAVATVPADASTIGTVTMNPAPTFESLDKSNSFAVYGRLQTDAALYQDDATDQGDGSTIRRLEIGVRGKFMDDFGFNLVPAFENDETQIRDAYLSYLGIRNSELRVGNIKEPMGMEQITSDLYITFMERSVPTNLFGPSRRVGAMALHHGYALLGMNWGMMAGVFGNDPSDTGQDEGTAYGARFYVAPINEKTETLHLGVAGRYRLTDANNVARFSDKPESAVTSLKIVDTGNIAGVEDYTTIGTEALYTHGPLSVQGEYFTTDVSRTGAPDATLTGGYGLVSWFVTGESRAYDANEGIMKRVSPKRNFKPDLSSLGALELAARYSTADLNDSGILGGETDNITLGANWYLNPRVKLMANYIMVDSEQPGTGVSDDPEVYTVRAQVDF